MLAIKSKDLAVIEAALNEIPLVSEAREKARAVIARIREFQSTPELLDEARELFAGMYRGALDDDDDDVSFDDEASTSPSDEGTFVSCWFWVPNPASDEEDAGE